VKLLDYLTEHPEMGDIDLELIDGDIITEIVVVARVQSLQNTDDQVIISVSDGVGGILQYGIVCAGKLQLEHWMMKDDEE
jgi:hypothetical protein